MKFKKVVSAVLLAAMTMTCMAGCGSNSDSQSGSGSSNSSSGSGDTIKIGGIGPVTGSAAVYGMAVKNGGESRQCL